MKHPLFLFLLLPISAYSASGASFDGCKGLTVTRSRDFSQVDVSADLQKAEKRINDLCGKVIPKRLKAINANAQSCVSGSTTEIGPGLASSMKAQVQSQMAGFDQRVKEACDSMKKSMEDSKRFCGLRKSSLDQLNRGISAMEKVDTDQAGAQEKVSGLYGSGTNIYKDMARSAGATKNRIYAKLPDKDERRSEYMRSGRENATTADPKTDKLISEWKSTLTLLAKDNKKKSACVKLAAKGGQLDEMGDILKNNLWPNGKVAARAMARVESADQAKANEFGIMKTESDRRLAASKIADGQKADLASDISGTEDEGGLKPMTQAETSEMYRKAQEGADLQQETKEICEGKGGCPDEAAVWAAIKEAQASEKGPEKKVVYSPAREAVSNNILGGATQVDQPGVLDDLERAPASIPQSYKAPDVPCITSVWSWWPPGWTETVGVKNGTECVVN